MSWTETDDKELQECYEKLIAAQKGLEAQIQPIKVIIANVTKITIRQVTSYNNKRKQITTKILPKDKWGEKMADEYRLKVKDECITKTNEILGVEHES